MDPESISYSRVVTLQGMDVAGQTYWSWEWDDDKLPGWFAPDPARLEAVLLELHGALPHLQGEPSDLGDAPRLREFLNTHPIAEVPAFQVRLHQSRELAAPRETEILRSLEMVAHCVRGRMSTPKREGRLSSRLSELLLPKALTRRLRKEAVRARSDGEGVLFRVLPAPSCTRVPWEILTTRNPHHKDERLIDVADVLTMAPLLGRDGNRKAPHPDWDSVRNNPPVRMIDPGGGAEGPVLKDAKPWTRRLAATKGTQRAFVASSPMTTRGDLENALSGPQRPSRLMYVGHVSANEQAPESTALVLSSERGRDAHFTALEALVGLGEVSATGAVLPASSPMPPRVALIACQSGIDLGQVEPFGLVTAFLELGAELVTATRWTLLTDLSFELMGSSATPLLDLSLKIDELHDGHDPIHGLSEWQRERLQAWRETGEIGDSPLIWAAVTNFYAPDRTDRGHGAVNQDPNSYDDSVGVGASPDVSPRER